MKNTFKRIAVIVMAVLMCVSTMVPAFAAGNACPGDGKTHTAYNCTYVEANKQDATCDAAGFVTGKCTTCGTIFSVSQTEALGHDWDATTAAVCGYAATKTCKRCGDVETVGTALEHLYTAWTLTEGECGTVGARITKTCVYCGDVQVDKIGNEGHVYALVSYVVPAKCIDKGLATYECTVAGCDAVKEVDIYSDLASHDYRDWTDDDGKDVNYKRATCDSKGRVSMICDDCEKVVVVATDKVVCDVDHKEAKAAECTKAGNIEYWLCPDCGVYYTVDVKTLDVTVDEVAEDKIITKADTVIPAIHDGLTTSADAIDAEYLPTCDTAGLVLYSCKVPGCDKAGELTLDKYADHVYYADVKTVAEKAEILNALANDKDFTKNWTDAKVESVWAKLGEVKVGGVGENLVWKNYTPATCEKNATVTYLCLNCTYSYETGAYVFVTCNVATETVLTGEGYDKLVHAYADTYPLSHSTKPGQTAYAWDGGLEASCKTVGRRVNYCINEYQLPDGTYASCDKQEIVGVAALGHDYVAYDADKIDDAANYTLKNATVTGADLKVAVAADAVTCMEDGKAYQVCTRCNEVIYTTVTSAGTEHTWQYYDANGNEVPAVTYANCTDEVKGYYRMCTVEGCKAGLTMEPIVVPARGHNYVNTDDKAVIEALLAIANVGDVDAKGNKLVKKGTCENGAIYSLKCEYCNIPKAFEIKDGFGEGHDKTYLPNTAIASTCTVAGSSNKWFCSNEGCEFFGFYNNDGDLVLNVTVDELKSDVVYGTTHQIWNAKKEIFEDVTYKNVPDAAIANAEDLDAAGDVEAPVVDGKVVKYVAIEGTTYVWVYKYTSEDHREASVDEGFLFCVACGDYDEFDTVGHSMKTEVKDATCDSIGYTYTYCTKCFEGAITGFEEAEDHVYHFVTEVDDDKYTIDTNKWNTTFKGTTTAKENGLNYVAPTCTVAGYAIDKCTTCDKVVTISVKPTGHVNENNQELNSSCLNTAYPRKCEVCGVTVNKVHVYDENAICMECGAAK